jgi:hypothetical protein
MNKILMYQDQTIHAPGPYLEIILQFLRGDCSIKEAKTMSSLRTVNTFFNCIEKCKFAIVLNKRRCKIHDRDHFRIEEIIIKSKMNNYGWWHFDTIQMANKAHEYVSVYPEYTSMRCCGGLGYKMS